MPNRTHRKTKLVAAGLMIAAVLFAGAGLTAANTVPDSRAGDGSGTISGYTVSNIDYTLLSADPTKFDKVTFDLSADPGTSAAIKTQVDGAWHDCTNVTTAVTCDFASGSEPTVAGATSLQVVVAQ